jgi:hypothetical protein
MGPCELDDEVRPTLAHVLGSRLRSSIEELAAGRSPIGIGQVEMSVDDEADCEDVEGNRVSAFRTGQCCYRLRASIAVDSLEA